MECPNIEVLKTFDVESLPDLDVAVLGALELFALTSLPEISVNMYERPLVVGSGNAEVTGKIIFGNRDAVFASESNYEEKLKNIQDIDGVVIVSASGGKHAPIIVKCSKEYGKHITLITNTVNSETEVLLDHKHPYDEFVFPKNREPYTYNTSTYMGMIFGHTKEDPRMIKDFIENEVEKRIPNNFREYEAFYFIIPSRFDTIRGMLSTKFDELFEPNVSGRIFTPQQTKHAKTIIHSKKEFFISFGEENDSFGEEENRLYIPLPEEADYGAVMAISYYVIGHIQKQHPPYFKDGIVEYTKEASKMFGENISPIVE